MFTHASLTHLFFKMFALRDAIRRTTRVPKLGSKRFLLYYMVTWRRGGSVAARRDIDRESSSLADGVASGTVSPYVLQSRIHAVTIGALVAGSRFRRTAGLRHDASQLDDHVCPIPPIPIKAKYFVIGYGLLELYLGMSGQPKRRGPFRSCRRNAFGMAVASLLEENR